MKRIFIIFLLCILFFSFVGIGHYTYFGTTEKEFTVAWDAPVNADNITNYELRLYHVEREVYEPIISVDNLTLRYTTRLPRSGHFIVYIRSINNNAEEEFKYGLWVHSTDINTGSVNGERRAWWLYGHIAKPGEINFN